jgi:hypothetical protein
MKRLLTRVLTGLALLGLVLSPVARPAMAMATGAVAQADIAAPAMDMADMPCCPDSAPKPDCAKDCPLMATCMGKTLQSAPHTSAPLVTYARASIVIPRNDARPDGFAQPPPPRPPDV